jgi:hypothetical protein
MVAALEEHCLVVLLVLAEVVRLLIQVSSNLSMPAHLPTYLFLKV